MLIKPLFLQIKQNRMLILLLSQQNKELKLLIKPLKQLLMQHKQPDCLFLMQSKIFLMEIMINKMKKLMYNKETKTKKNN